MLYIEDIVPEPDPADGLISRACMARYLLGLMASDYSETYFFSSWATDLEYHLWDAVHGKRVEVALGTAMLEEDERKLILELATNPGLAYSFNSYAQIESSPSAVMEFVRKRVDAWTDGKDPEPWPAAASVSDERRTEISEKLATLPAAEITPFAGSLPPGERLALMEIIGSYDESNPAPPGLMELRQTIVSLAPLFASGHDAEAAAKLGIAVGEQITPELLTRISDDLLNDAAARSATTVMFYPAAMNLGTTLYVLTAADLDPKKVRTSGLSNLARLFETFGNRPALSAIHFGNVADMLALENGKPVTLESEGSALTDFTKALEAKTAVLPPIRISVLTLEDAEKINNQDR